KYRVLEKKDCWVNTRIIDDPKKQNVRNATLPWIWGMGSSEEEGRHLKDCEWISIVLRVHWLRAKAMQDRWQEELTIVIHEMQWVPNFFHHKADEWKDRADDSTDSPGHWCYAICQHNMWRRFANTASSEFEKIKLL
ncbi:hypothetical protein JAAARDRAFT_92566, partial [Jaapia argillacea MUCL 33604]